MGIRGELYSSKVLLRSRSYFFNIKENRNGDLYFNIVESKSREGAGFERQSVIVFDEDLQEFLKGFDEALKVFEKTAREKRRQGGGQSGFGKRADRGGDNDGFPGKDRDSSYESNGYTDDAAAESDGGTVRNGFFTPKRKNI